MNLQFLNQLKRDNKEQRRLQNKRYRQKHRDILNLKKQMEYHKKTYDSKLSLHYKINQTEFNQSNKITT